jgi:hypothetical protein
LKVAQYLNKQELKPNFVSTSTSASPAIGERAK